MTAFASPEATAASTLIDRWPWLLVLAAVIYFLRASFELAGLAEKNRTGITRLFSREARERAEVDGRVKTASEHIELLEALVETATTAANASRAAADSATATAAAAEESARQARTQLDVVADELRDWRAWARTYWPRIRAVLDERGHDEIPDPYPLTVHTEAPQ